MRILIIAAAALAATATQAQRIDASRLTCAQARSVVAQSGAVVLGSGPYIYDRYVASNQFCSFGEVAQQGFISTRDNAYCPVGGLCYTPDRHRAFDD